MFVLMPTTTSALADAQAAATRAARDAHREAVRASRAVVRVTARVGNPRYPDAAKCVEHLVKLDAEAQSTAARAARQATPAAVAARVKRRAADVRYGATEKGLARYSRYTGNAKGCARVETYRGTKKGQDVQFKCYLNQLQRSIDAKCAALGMSLADVLDSVRAESESLVNRWGRR